MKSKRKKIEGLRDFLDLKVEQYNRPEFLESDPIQIPHLFSDRRDIEISGFLTATIAWGNRKSIITNASLMMDLMDRSPYQFISQHEESDLSRLDGFIHRTFNGTDIRYFVRALQHIYTHHGGMEAVFCKYAEKDSLQRSISRFRTLFFGLDHEKRTEKHISDPLKGSAAKRINMFLRWMVRDGKSGVDFGLWKGLKPSQLSCPLDVHSGKVARKLGLLTRKQNDAKAVNELDSSLRLLDPNDPVKYDFALFGLGVFERF
ncbi:TIGR02757 family protein [Muriicola jejuensis]|uniref:TIGR02757 family protein n=1 Tax=Muriicola jejuensis TaxID=504488 RepID=A0A6P0UD53_9FLAO|nr:TIGR02757 family protein [Muriicola jejuensis]NER11185.1 TIGR02757 family protein [Muriicola jejuensis]SMP24200.1 TIGR02757 family protein [Muriicola jejuensis]